MHTRTYTKGIGLRISIGFLMVVLLMVTLTFIALKHMAQVNLQMKNIVENNNVKVELGQVMQDALHERALIMHTLPVLKDPFMQDDEFIRFNAMGSRYVKARQKLDSLVLTDSEKEILSEIRVLTKKTQPFVQKVVEIGFEARNDSLAFDEIREIAIPMQRMIAEQVRALIVLQQQQAKSALNKEQLAYEQARTLMLLLGGVAVILGILIAIFVLRHVTKQAALLEHQALHDELTGLANRTLFDDRLKKMVLRGQRQAVTFSTILIDLVRFKSINDSYGHNIGDLLLKEVARRLKANVRKMDTVARLGGDEFVVVLEALDHTDLIQFAEKLVETMSKPFLLAGHEINVGISMGISSYPEHGHDCATLINRADIAMYEAKSKNTPYVYYTDKIKKKANLNLVRA